MACFPFDDHNCPPIQLIISFCQSAYSWLKEDIENVVVVHCKAGMARTGLMISSLLLFLKVRCHSMFLNNVTMHLVEILKTFCVLYIIFFNCGPTCHLFAVLPDCWGVNWLLQSKKMFRRKGACSAESDCQSFISMW